MHSDIFAATERSVERPLLWSFSEGYRILSADSALASIWTPDAICRQFGFAAPTYADRLIQSCGLNSRNMLELIEHCEQMGMPDPLKNDVKSLERLAGWNMMLDLQELRASSGP